MKKVAVIGAVVGGVSAYPACADGVSCFTITPADKPDLTFDCSYVSSTLSTTNGFVYHMHGNDGPQSKAMFADTMLQLADVGFSSLACDGRGYSPGAAPNDYNAYHYDALQSDIFSIVDESKYSADFNGKFHLVAHDQGARVAWHSVAMGEGRKRFLSLTSLSIPHSDVFSNALLSASSDADQQQASQYVRQLVLPDSVTFDTGEIEQTVCAGQYASVEACQKTLWWYNGAIDSGAMALAPMMAYNSGSIAASIGIPEDKVEEGTQYPLEGVAQSTFVGNVTEFPVFYGCGDQDSCDLCKQAFSDESEALVQDYSYLGLPACGHDVLGCAESQSYIDKIIANIQKAYA